MKYRIAYYGDKYLCWCDEQKRFIPSVMHLYVTVYKTLEDAMKAAHRIKHDYATGWVDNIYIESFV